MYIHTYIYIHEYSNLLQLEAKVLHARTQAETHMKGDLLVYTEAYI